MKDLIVIEGEVVEVEKIIKNGNGYDLECGNKSYTIYPDSETAGIDARENWIDMAKHDKEEFLCTIGEEALIAWGLGEWHAVGSTSVQSLKDWFDLHLDCPEEHFASYDGEEIEIFEMNKNLFNQLWFNSKTCVAYRVN